MTQKRFFATLAFARQMITKDRTLKGLLLATFYHAYTCGWQDKNSSGVKQQ